jgi:CO/xanthine dehydrogenase Mo-binding subunit
VLTYEDVPDVLYGQLVQDRRLFARDRVRFEGDVVAAVAALTPAIAAEAAAVIDVEYEPLQAVSDPELAIAEDAPLIH